MVKLKKLTVSQLDATYGTIPTEELRQLTGGDGTTTNDGGYGFPGFCFYDSIAYMGREFGCYDHAPEWYCSDFINGNGSLDDDWEDTKDPKNVLGVPLYKDNELNRDAFNYMSNYFDMQGSDWATASQTTSFFESTSSGRAIGIYQTAHDTAHAVVLTGYSDGYYTYTDPSTGQTGKIAEKELIGAALTNGCK